MKIYIGNDRNLAKKLLETNGGMLKETHLSHYLDTISNPTRQCRKCLKKTLVIQISAEFFFNIEINFIKRSYVIKIQRMRQFNTQIQAIFLFVL